MKKIPLTQGRFALVDDVDFQRLSKWTWCVSSGYAVRGVSSGGARCFKMHRVIIGARKEQEVDHVDGDRLNNQKDNLRIATRSQNQANRVVCQKDNKSGYKGVSWCKKHNKWLAQIRVRTRTKFLGYFSNPEDAGKSYDLAAKKYFGEFANTNKLCQK